jgi:hypothetical protein
LSSVTAFSILFLTVGLSLSRPRFGNVRIYPPVAATIGAILMMAAGLVTVQGALGTLSDLLRPIITIASLMTSLRAGSLPLRQETPTNSLRHCSSPAPSSGPFSPTTQPC